MFFPYVFKTGGGAAAPTLSSLNYAQGDTLGGGQPIVLTGTGFTDATLVEFGTTSATFTVDSDTQITATLPAHAAAVVDVTVTGPGGSDALTLAFEFWDPSQLPALQEFLDTSVGLTADGSGLVTGWTSRAGASAGTWVVAGGVPAPSKVADAFGPGIPALRIDSSLKGIRRSAAYTFNSSDKSVFYVGKWTSTDTAATYPLINPPLTAIGWSGWTGLGASGGEAMFVSYNSVGNARGEIQGGAGLNDGGPHLVGVTNPPAGITDLYADNAVVASSASGAFSFYGIDRIGANAGDYDGLVGDLGAFIVLASSAGGSGIPSTSDRNKLYAWARQRFGVA